MPNLPPPSVSAERAARNGAMYHVLNARGVLEADWICECADPACAMLVTASLKEYGRIRVAETEFLVYPGHSVRASVDGPVAARSSHR